MVSVGATTPQGGTAHGARTHRREGQQAPTAGGHNTAGRRAAGGYNAAGGTSTQGGLSHPPTIHVGRSDTSNISCQPYLPINYFDLLTGVKGALCAYVIRLWSFLSSKQRNS